MATRTEKKNEFLNLLNQRLRENSVWRDLFIATSAVLDDYFNERVTQLSRVRDPQHVHRGDYLDTPEGRGKVDYIKKTFNSQTGTLDEISVEIPGVGSVVVPFRATHERSVLINGARSLGFDYFSDKILDEDYARIYKFVAEYWQESGTEQFVNFMGYVKSMRLEIEQLWTRDKGDNATSDDAEISKYAFLEPFDPNTMVPVWEGLINGSDIDNTLPHVGLDYPTSHVALAYDITVSQVLDVFDLVNLFYYLAPIHLVLERITATVNVDIPTYRGHGSQMHYYDHGHLILDSSFNGLIDFTNSTTVSTSLSRIVIGLQGKNY